MFKVTISCPGQETQIMLEHEEKISSLLRYLDPKYAIMAARKDNHAISMDDIVDGECRIDFLDIRDNYANMAYQTSLTLLYCRAIHDILGEEMKVAVANSLSRGLFTTIKTTVTNELADEIENRMKELCKSDEKIETDGGKARMGNELHNVSVHLVPSASWLGNFEVKRYRNGMLLRFAHPSKPDEIPVYEEQKMMYDAFSEELQWQRLLGVNYANDLNKLIEKGGWQDMILLSEALHEKKIAEIAYAIKTSGKRMVLIAGPSSSGKTTFAKRLCIQLRVNGLKPLYLGMDDYFVDRCDMVPDENGKLDFESISAIDVGLFEKQMNALLDGSKCDIPEFDFVTGKKVFGKRITSLEKGQPIVVEGIHGLNPQMSAGVPDEQKFKIYISPLTQLNIDPCHRVPTTDARMLRRMVRDERTRGYDAEQTIMRWPEVRAGEDVNIFPYSKYADVFFNSHCIYELAVLKKYCEPLLKKIEPVSPAYPEATRMLRFLSYFDAIEDERYIPNNSIVREFIGGGVIMS